MPAFFPSKNFLRGLVRWPLLLALLFSADAAQAGGSGGTIFVPLACNRSCTVYLEFTSIPPLGSLDNLQGKVYCVQPAGYQVAVFIYTYGWYTKPTWAQPLTTIQPDGTWTADITTGSGDEQAAQIAAFLIPNSYTPPLMKGDASLAAELFANSVAYQIYQRGPAPRQITFSGRSWSVRSSPVASEPGPNFFSDRAADVWVDGNGYLHLTLVYRDGHWWSTEVVSDEVLGYGVYTFVLDGAVDTLDPNAVLGLFTYDDTSALYSHREIDIEFSRWGNPAAQNVQYAIQPWGVTGNRYRFFLSMSGPVSTHRFTWNASSVQFASYAGEAAVPAPGDLYQTWSYSGASLPPAGQGLAHLNLWLLDGQPPANGQPLEVVIKAFTFTPVNP